MPMLNKLNIIWVMLPLVIAVVIAGGVWLAFHACDPHWLNRSGALVAAIAAGAILLQINAELQLEEERENLASRINKLGKESLAMTIDGLAARLERNRVTLEKARLPRRRLLVAAVVVGSAILGELLHGFGDIVMCYLFEMCGRHL